MRIVSKGGVWKNTEDEILKASVMKYGLNQWARISSLLVRKSAKQCKARWFEWLDPNIKKTEWSREEEEKLLHLAKIMPNQWKTIAPIVGRTAAQCVEHYEKLLDAAQMKDTGAEGADDSRRLRPGEIDPSPETKPARPDPIDMDEDEKEMLSEARARLANTKGKKAKRKAREKQLEEARRLAVLQKRRELKAAGIDMPKFRRKVRGVDYLKEIPFQKKPPPGFYEVDFTADQAAQGQFKKPLLHNLNGKRRSDEQDNRERDDSKKQKTREKSDLPKYIMQINKLNDPSANRVRPKLILPSPTLSDSELETLAKMSAQGGALPAGLEDVAEGGEGSKAATRALLPNLGPSPSPFTQAGRTPLTARTPAREDAIMREAQNLIALTQGATPLAGGVNVELHPSDFSGVTPKRMDARTPNVLATPLRAAGAGAGAGSGSSYLTPRRAVSDELMSIMESKHKAKQQQEERKKLLQAGLKGLPAPQNEYKIVLPDLPAEETEESKEDGLEKDASDVLTEQQRKEEEAESRRKKLYSHAIQRSLPRPAVLERAFLEFKSQQSNAQLAAAEELVRQEMVRLIVSEAVTVPYAECRISENLLGSHYAQEESSSLTLEELESARGLVLSETATVKSSLSEEEQKYGHEEVSRAWRNADSEMLYSHEQRRYLRSATATKKEKVAALEHEHEQLREVMKQEATRAAKLGKKLDVYHRGYETRATTLLQQVSQLHVQLDQASIELACFRSLQQLERTAMPARVEQLSHLVQQQEARESANQRRFEDLKLALDAKRRPADAVKA